MRVLLCGDCESGNRSAELPPTDRVVFEGRFGLEIRRMMVRHLPVDRGFAYCAYDGLVP